MLKNVLLISYKNNIRNGECKTKDFDPTSRYFAQESSKNLYNHSHL